ncbi:MAG: CFI-box-CTERM domain-containing protein [Candidatus Thorarchaeota archaeon]
MTSCDRCGIVLPEGTQPVGTCLKCQNPVYMCQNHRAKMVGEEIFCKEHESDCFIATAVFGTALDPQIDILRDFRDEWLLTSPLGKAFVFAYYEISPPIARRARHSILLRRILRRTIVNPALAMTKFLFGK